MLEVAPDGLVFAGDWHGNLAWATQAVAYSRQVHGADTILHVGDFAYTFDPRFIRGLENTLARHQLRLFFLRGNHDDAHHLSGFDPTGHGNLRVDPTDPDSAHPWPLSEHIAYLPDALRLRIGTRTAVVAGGAGSIDRVARMPGIEWWENERLDPAAEAYCVLGGGADILLCHDAPTGVPVPLDPAFAEQYEAIDPGVTAWCDTHRDSLETVAEALDPHLIVFGHHHERISLSWGSDCEAIGLDRDNSTFSGNLAPCWTIAPIDPGE